MSFDTTKTTLRELLADIHSGHLQLPEFQRDYVWDEGDVCSLLESIAKGFPVGALLTLERGGLIEFKPRRIEGAPEVDVAPEHLLLDGQQRMTSLYMTVYSKKPARVRTPRKQIVERYFYLAIDRVLEAPSEIGLAIETLPPDRIRRNNFARDIELDLSTPSLEYESMMFPLNQALDPLVWILGCISHWNSKARNRTDELTRFQSEVLERIKSYAMPVIRLGKTNSREAVCTVFEKVNVGGKKLDAFELVTAIYAGSGFDLRQDWAGGKDHKGRLGRLRDRVHSTKGIFVNLAATDFLQACTLLHTREVREQAIASGATGKAVPGVTCTREALLGLPRGAYEKHADSLEKGFLDAARFLNEQRILWGRDLPYPSQMVALASVFALLPANRRNAEASRKIAHWFWSGVLGEFYGSATETKIARDVPDLLAWLEQEGPVPQTNIATSFQANRLESLRSRTSAAYKGFSALLMRSGCRDFIKGTGVDVAVVFSDPLDIHHIFPRAWCEKRGIAPARYNSIINKTALSARSNREIGGRAPSEYLARITREHQISPHHLDDILRSHLIEPALLRADDFEGFWAARKAALAQLAAEAQGKPVVPDDGTALEGYTDEDADQDDDDDTSAPAGEDA